MNYTDAPACKLLATHCACCGRPLLDAKSVEFGIGPDCRQNYGFDDVPNKPDWFAGKTIAANYEPALLPSIESWTDARIACNKLVHLFALDVVGRKWVPEAVFALGYVKLSEKLAERGGRVEVKAIPEGSTTPTEFHVRTPYNPSFGSRAVPGMWFNKRGTPKKHWVVPARSRVQLWAALRQNFAGMTLVSAQGVSTIPSYTPPPVPAVLNLAP